MYCNEEGEGKWPCSGMRGRKVLSYAHEEDKTGG